MVAGNVSRVLRAPGRLVVSPSDFGIAYPYGGVEVGRVKLAALQTRGDTYRITSELRGQTVEVLEANIDTVVSFFLRGWDDDALEQLLSDGNVAGAVSQHQTYNVPGNVVPGASASLRAKSMVLVPDDVVAVPALLIHRGVPGVSAGSDVMFQRGEEFGVSIVVECLPDTTGDVVVEIGRIADLTAP